MQPNANPKVSEMFYRRNRTPGEKPEGSRLMSQSAAARALGFSRIALMRRVATGEIASEMVDETPVIVRASLDAYRKRMAAEPISA